MVVSWYFSRLENMSSFFFIDTRVACPLPMMTHTGMNSFSSITLHRPFPPAPFFILHGLISHRHVIQMSLKCSYCFTSVNSGVTDRTWSLNSVELIKNSFVSIQCNIAAFSHFCAWKPFHFHFVFRFVFRNLFVCIFYFLCLNNKNNVTHRTPEIKHFNAFIQK